MKFTLIDVILVFTLFILIFSVVNTTYNNVQLDNTIIFDDDVYIINSNNIFIEDDKPCHHTTNTETPANTETPDNTETPLISNFENKVKYDRINNRYNRKLNNTPSEDDLSTLVTELDSLSDDNLLLENYNNLNIDTSNENTLDSKGLNKSNRLQKLFKDSKTIAGRFTKNSIIDDYKYELDYYENLKTPWWV